jgi:hypothetical protein
MLERNRRRVQNLSGLELWLFIIGRVLASAGLGVLAMAYFRELARPLAWPAITAGALLLLLASRGLVRKPSVKD